MVDPYEGEAKARQAAAMYWVAEYRLPDGSDSYAVGVYTSEEKAMAGAVKFILHHGWPAITDFRFSSFKLNDTKQRD